MKTIEEELQKTLTEIEVLKNKRDVLTKAYKIKQEFATKITSILDEANSEFYLKNEKLIKTFIKSFDESKEEVQEETRILEPSEEYPEEADEFVDQARHVYKEPKKHSKEEQSKTIKDFLS